MHRTQDRNIHHPLRHPAPPYYTPHFDGLGSERLVGFALRPKTIHKLADRINMKSTEVLDV
jgi:hypothetical protein